ncbi:MAG: glycosyltransferase family A protein [Candidatus Paceibacterota bacterium]
MVNNKKNKNLTAKLPFVSICTPTFNRRPFISAMIECFNHQDYPKDKIEWIILDDGTDKIGDLVTNIPQVKYFKYDEKMTLGKKRNLMHEKSRGDIIVYMDDDDYYPPQRVSHAVEMLLSRPDALCAGSSRMYIYFKHLKQNWEFGPYGPNHATAGTFAFKRELLKHTRYDDNASIAEEKAFLKNYTIPFVQLDPLKVILVFSHEHNTFDKRKLLDMPHPLYCKPCELKIEEFIKEPKLKEFYMNEIEELLKTYEPGRPEMKPDVLKQIVEIEQRRKREIENYNNKKNNNVFITVQQPGKPPLNLNSEQVIDLLRKQTAEIGKLQKQVDTNIAFVKLLKDRLLEKDNIINEFKNNINVKNSTNPDVIDENKNENIMFRVTEKNDDSLREILREINGE